MLTVALERNPAEYYHFLVSARSHRKSCSNLNRVLMIPGEIFFERARRPRGAFLKSGPVRIVPRPSDDGPKRSLDFFAAWLIRLTQRNVGMNGHACLLSF